MYLFDNLSKCILLVLLIYFISAAVILLASLALIVQVSLHFIPLIMPVKFVSETNIPTTAELRN